MAERFDGSFTWDDVARLDPLIAGVGASVVDVFGASSRLAGLLEGFGLDASVVGAGGISFSGFDELGVEVPEGFLRRRKRREWPGGSVYDIAEVVFVAEGGSQ